jgi:hypothetical protein
MKKLLSAILVVAMVFALGTSGNTVKAAEQSIIYKVTPTENYKETEGRYMEFTDTGETISYGDWQEYIRLGRNVNKGAHGISITAIVDLSTVELIKSKTISRGMYLVNNEIKPGKYKITGNGTAIMMSDVLPDKNADFIQDTQVTVSKGEIKYITVKKGHFALYLSGKNIKATRVK